MQKETQIFDLINKEIQRQREGIPVVSMPASENNPAEQDFVEFRRKVRSAEVLSASTQQLLRSVRFTGRVSIVVQNGRVLKSGYEEGYFTHRPLKAGAA